MAVRVVAFSARPALREQEPLSQINITPLIDVMLVLLIMMILTIPMATHKVPIDLPQPGPASPPGKDHVIAMLANGGITLDGKAIDSSALEHRLEALSVDSGNAFDLRIDGMAHYGGADALLATIKRAGITRLGFVGTDRFVDSIR
jgi:biopolymer transport protein ExbD